MGRMNRWIAIVALCLGGATWAAAADPLIDAAKNNDIEALRLHLKQGVLVNAPEADGSTALHWAVRKNNVEIAGVFGCEVKSRLISNF